MSWSGGAKARTINATCTRSLGGIQPSSSPDTVSVAPANPRNPKANGLAMGRRTTRTARSESAARSAGGATPYAGIGALACKSSESVIWADPL